VFSLLAVLVALGATDLACAWSVRHVLSIAAREAARVTVSTPLTSRTCQEPMPNATCSIQLAADAAKQSLANAGFNQAVCITPKTPSFSGVLVWVYSCDGIISCNSREGSVCLKIDMTALELGGDKAGISNTRVTLQYPHAGTLGFLARMLPGGLESAFPKAISASASVRN